MRRRHREKATGPSKNGSEHRDVSKWEKNEATRKTHRQGRACGAVKKEEGAGWTRQRTVSVTLTAWGLQGRLKANACCFPNESLESVLRVIIGFIHLYMPTFLLLGLGLNHTFLREFTVHCWGKQGSLQMVSYPGLWELPWVCYEPILSFLLRYSHPGSSRGHSSVFSHEWRYYTNYDDWVQCIWILVVSQAVGLGLWGNVGEAVMSKQVSSWEGSNISENLELLSGKHWEATLAAGMRAAGAQWDSLSGHPVTVLGQSLWSHY